MTEDEKGNTELSDLGIEVPDWIDQDLTVFQVDAIVQGGCASGAYMPAVTYWQALETMSKYGDDVIQYIEGSMGEAPRMGGEVRSWSSLTCDYLSWAVNLWAVDVWCEIDDAIEGLEEEAAEC